MITEEIINDPLNLLNIVEEESCKILHRYIDLKLWNKKGYTDQLKKHLIFDSMDSSNVYFVGEDNWAYGGHEEYYLEIPVEFLYDEDAWTHLENEVIEEKKKIKRRV